ncbi:MAG TPA: nucleoside hydrolase [Gaiellaceae bacterium]|nr:nucleoside hydrolase [Gaiellaceae bacterium]
MIPLLVDCDPGQDDAIALLLALASPEVDVLGVTTVAGNQTLERTTANALRVLELAGRGDVPVAAGADRPLVRELVTAADAHGESGLDGPDLPPPRGRPVPQPAPSFLAERILAAPEPPTLVALGPLTNVALLLAAQPEAARRLARIVLMGGAIAEGNMTASAEFNVFVDPEAAARVFGSGLDVTMVGLDVTNRAVLTPADAERLRPQGPVGAAVAAMLDVYGAFYREAYDLGGCPVHDAVAVAHVLDPSLVGTVERRVDVELGEGLCRGRTVVDLRRRRSPPPPNARVAVDVDAAAFVRLLLERLPQLPAGPGV